MIKINMIIKKNRNNKKIIKKGKYEKNKSKLNIIKFKILLMILLSFLNFYFFRKRIHL
jgi:sugar phosphate permease